MKDKDKVIKKYNEGQDKIHIRDIYKNVVSKEYEVEYTYKKNKDNYFEHSLSTDFYEWLINPKYKVFETLKIKVYAVFFTNEVGFVKFKQPEQILKYLAEK